MVRRADDPRKRMIDAVMAPLIEQHGERPLQSWFEELVIANLREIEEAYQNLPPAAAHAASDATPTTGQTPRA